MPSSSCVDIKSDQEVEAYGPPVTRALMQNERKSDDIDVDVDKDILPAPKRFWVSVGVFATGLFGCGLISLGWGLYTAGIVRFVLHDLGHQVKDIDEIFTRNVQAAVFASKVSLLWEVLATCFGTALLAIIIRALFDIPALAKHRHVDVMKSMVVVIVGVVFCYLQSAMFYIRSSAIHNATNYPLCE